MKIEIEATSSSENVAQAGDSYGLCFGLFGIQTGATQGTELSISLSRSLPRNPADSVVCYFAPACFGPPIGPSRERGNRNATSEKILCAPRKTMDVVGLITSTILCLDHSQLESNSIARLSGKWITSPCIGLPRYFLGTLIVIDHMA